MFTILSLVTSVKDYIEIVHKLVETNTSNPFEVSSYYDFGAILTYLVLSGKEVLSAIFTFKWLQNIASLPLIVPEISAAMLSEISVLDGYFHNAFTFLETPLSYGNQNVLFYSIEKFSIGLINSIFLCLPTSTAHIITLRRFVMQGLEAGYLAGLGTLAGNVLWIGSILFGLRFIVIPWLSLDILRYGLGFLLLVKYMWDSYSERRTVLEDLSKWKIFFLNFLLAFTEQATIYPFLSNLSIGSDATILESFPAGSFGEYTFIHFCYLAGLIVGSLSLLQLSCWFWENPAFNIYMWAMSSLKMTTTFSQRFVNLCFLYLTMFFAVSNISYFGLDYTVTNPLGFVHEDRLIEQKSLLETSFLNTKASDRNTRRNRGRHGRRERWKRRVRRYRTFDASLYDQGVYDLFTIEDLNYGFDRFWLRRKIRNHRVRFRFFPGPWMRSFKKQLARPRLESFMGPRVEFFRILFEQSYHPEFHEFRTPKSSNSKVKNQKNEETLLNDKNLILLKNFKTNNLISSYSEKNQKVKVDNLRKEYSALRKFVRKIKTRTNSAEILLDLNRTSTFQNNSTKTFENKSTKSIYSKRWKQIFSKISHNVNDGSVSKGLEQTLLNKFYKQTLLNPISTNLNSQNYFKNFSRVENEALLNWNPTSKQNSEKQLSKKDRQILRYRTFLTQTNLNSSPQVNNKKNLKSQKISHENEIYEPLTLLHPIKFYLQKEQAFKKKMKFYGASLFRNFGVENNAPYYRVMMKKFFYYYKPTLRWERTMRTATMRKARRKGPHVPRKLNINKKTQMLASGAVLGNNVDSTFNSRNQSVGFEENKSNTELSFENLNSKTKIQKPTHFYSLVSKRATRYRYQIYKDVLQHWYYSPFNRLLLKFDVDSFIRRQPTSHFLTKKEENLLHLKRYLLSDYYNTLRWYSYMQHYDSMKTNIGKTKSFASRSYNQQFFGTFKKIRHLFAVTPSLSETNVLKFDQPLFNEYKNNEKSFNKNYSLYDSSWIHEELLADESLYSTTNVGKNLPEDLPTQSTKILKEYLEKAQPIREEYIQKLLEEQNYSELTRFLFKGEKIRGTAPVTNETTLLDQEKDYLLASEIQNLEKEKIQNFLKEKMFNQSFVNSQSSIETTSTQDPRYLWVSLMKKSRNMLYNQEALKLYVAGRVEKLEKQKKRQEKSFQTRLTNMKNWVALQPDKNNQIEQPVSGEFSGLTSSLQKAVKEGIYYQMSGSYTGKNLEKSNLRNNREKVLTNLSILEPNTETSKMKKRKILTTKSPSTNLSVNLKSHLENRVRLRAVQAFNAEHDIRKNFVRIQEIVKKQNPEVSLKNLNPTLLKKIVNATLLPFKYVSVSIVNKLQTIPSSNTGSMIFQPLRSTLRLLTKNREKSFKNWKQKETVLSTRKKIRRKIYRVLDQKRQMNKTSNVQELENLGNLNNTPLRQKQDSLETLETDKNKKSWNQYEKANLRKWTSNDPTVSKTKESTKSFSSNFFSNLFEKNFKRKRTRSRRYRRFKGRGPIKKHTLAEKLKRQFKLLKRYGDKDKGMVGSTLDKKIEILQMITKREYNPNTFFEPRETKQRRTRQSKHRYWKKHKRQKYLQMKRKQRKRRRYSLSKLRVLNKEFKRIQSQVELKNWWWQTFLPNFMTTTDAFWQIEKNKQIQQEFEKLSIKDILDRDELVRNQQPTAMLQIGNQDFKPLAVPEALRLRENLIQKGELTFGTEKLTNEKLNSEILTSQNPMDLNSVKNSNGNFISTLSQNLLEKQIVSPKLLNTTTESKKFVNVNPMPFYAGWDETLRQFVVTNRLLSRKEAGYQMNLQNKNSNLTLPNSQTVEFTKAPLQGMNAATTLYWQIPFTTYDPDQFFALGMDGFSPLGWRFFNFKHSKQTTKPILVQNILYKNEKQIKNQSLLSYNLQMKMMNLTLDTKNSSLDSRLKTNNISKNQNRKIQKRQKRVKKHPRPPVWFPSGALANQVLPVHYIYVFYKRTRLPRDRYIGRRFRRADDPKASFIKSNFTKMLDFTLRKRVKPIRKYHRKRNIQKNQETSLILRRRPFKTLMNENLRFRPIAKTRLTTQTDILNSSLLKTKQRKKSLTNKQNSENLRIRQLRRRIQRQVLRPILRYKPRAGGLVWPGDYLRLETVKVPVLNNLETSKTNVSSTNSSNSQIRQKKRRAIQEWQIQPKKYLREKHNLKVLKKRLQKSQNFNNLSQKIKELNLTF